MAYYTLECALMTMNYACSIMYFLCIMCLSVSVFVVFLEWLHGSTWRYVRSMYILALLHQLSLGVSLVFGPFLGYKRETTPSTSVSVESCSST